MILIGEKTGKDIEKAKFTLSENDYNRFITDLYTFNITRSDLVALIISAYCRDSEKLRRLEAEQCREGGHIRLDSFMFKCALTKLSDHALEEPMKITHRNFHKIPTKTIQWTITDNIANEMKRDSRSDGQTMTFVRDLIEEYLDLSFDKREKVVMHKQIEDVETAIKNNEAFVYTYLSGKSCVMHPYKIMVDSNTNFTYIVGHRISLENYNDLDFKPCAENVGTIRLLNMQYIEPRNNNISFPYKRRINETAIRERLKGASVAFLSQDLLDITVLLNPTGENMLRTIVHNRPMYIRSDKEYVDSFKKYILRCTLFQAGVYFCSFENNARIIDPPEAVEEVRSRLKKAYDMYR